VATNEDALVADQWTLCEGISTPLPAGTVAIDFYLTVINGSAGTITDIDYVSASRAADGRLVLDGAMDAKSITGATIIGGEIRTTEQSGAIAARMGPTSVWDPFGGTTKAGIGFSVAGNTQDPAGMYSPTGTDLMITQGGTTNSGTQAYINLGNNDVDVYAWDTVDITGRSGITLNPQNGSVSVTGPLSVTGTFTAPIRHCETNVITSYPPNNTVWGPGTFVKDTNKSFNDGFVTFPASDQIKFMEAGVYCVHLVVWNHSTTYSASRIFLKNAAGTVIHNAQAKAEGDVWEFSISIPNFHATANEIMVVQFLQTSGGTLQFDSKLRVTKLQ
jgi:hypothetical protein